MYGCDTMMMGGEPIEKSNEDDTSILALFYFYSMGLNT